MECPPREQDEAEVFHDIRSHAQKKPLIFFTDHWLRRNLGF